MRILFFMFIYLFSFEAFSREWPKEMYTIDKNLSKQFIFFSNYMDKVFNQYPYAMTENKVDFFKQNSINLEKVLTVHRRKSKTAGVITEKLYFYVNGVLGEKIILTYSGISEELDLIELLHLDFSRLNKATFFELQFAYLNLYMKIERIDFTLTAIYRVYGQIEDDIQLEETAYKYYRLSKLQALCENCENQVLIAKMYHKYGDMHYTEGSSRTELLPVEFYDKSLSLLSEVYKSFELISERLITEKNLPSVF